jgi:hypothetical protein
MQQQQTDRQQTDSSNSQLWIGTSDDPESRMVITISAADCAKLPARGKPAKNEAIALTDLTTGKEVFVRRANCGLPGCWCALEFVERADYAAVYSKLSRVACLTDRSEMNPKTHREFMTIIDRAQRIIYLEAEQAGVPIN